MMLRIDKEDDTITFVSDDADGENMALQDAIAEAAPHLLDDFEGTDVGDDGLLKFGVQRDDWSSVLEVMDALSPVIQLEGVSDEEIDRAIRS